MNAMTRVRYAALLAASAMLASACATMDVNSYAARDFTPQQFRTYAWGPNDISGTGDARLDNNEFLDAAVKSDVERELTARGFVKATGEPDLLIHWHANVVQEIDVRDLDREYEYCQNYDCRPYVYDAGTLFIDLVHAATNRLVWRGWAEGSVEGVVDNQDLLEERVSIAVARIAERLPRAM